jgi:hypothetical protein
MKTRNSLVFCALAVAALSCSDAVPPPASMGMHTSLSGVANVRTYVPEEHSVEVRKIELMVSPMTLEAIPLLGDGEGGADVKCRVHELGPDSHELSLTYKDEMQTTQVSLSATTTGNISQAGVVSVKSPLTGGTTYAGTACEAKTALAPMGGGAIVAQFFCDTGELRDQENCSESTPDCDRTLTGNVVVYLENCTK